MTRMSVAALVLAFAAFVIGVAAPVLDPAVLSAQLGLAQRVAERPEPGPAAREGETTLRVEAGRWIARKIRERNDRAEGGQAAGPAEERAGPLGALAPYVVPVQFLLALAALALALTDWLRTRALRSNLAAAAIAGAAIAVPFAWGAIGIAMGIAATIIALVIVGSLLGAIGG